MIDHRIFKGLGFIFMLFVLSSTLAFSADDIGISITSNDTNGINITPVEVSAPIVDANYQNPGILPPNSRPGGLTYGEWNAKWWQWAYSMPIDSHPLFDTADCSKGQSGNVWFLGSTFATEQATNGDVTATADRKCTIPPGKMLFIPMANVEGSKAENNGQTEAELREYTEEIMDHAIELSAEIDGRPIKNLETYKASPYKAPSPLFTFGPLPENNVLQFLYPADKYPEMQDNIKAGATSDSVADGIYLMLAPLSVGKHTIHFKGMFKFTEDQDGSDFVFKQDINYQITVKPNWRPPRMFMPKE
jgi:hypothetical protein